jgi:hypothetical protein
MDPIKPSSAAQALLRARLARAMGGLASAAKTPVPDAASGAEPDLRQVLAGLVEAVDPADPDALRRARRPVITAVLAHEFGEAMHADPLFAEMVAAVDSAMCAPERAPDPFVALVCSLQEKKLP